MKQKRMPVLVPVILLVFLSVSLFGRTGFGDSAESVVLNETLPVQLSSFTALVTTTGTVQLEWTAETETNMLGYNVYRGENGRLADAVLVNGRIIPAGNSSSTTEYVFTDEDVIAGNTYYYRLQTVDLDLTNEFFGPLAVTVEEKEDEEAPVVYLTALQNNYPNPFNPNTKIAFSSREDCEALLRVFNHKGQLVKTLVQGTVTAGNHTITWNGRDEAGREVASGVYFYRLSTNHYDNIQKMLLVK